jgi:hypothetical protein
MSNLAQVTAESERFLREEVGAEKCRIVDVLDFMSVSVMADPDIRSRVKLRKFDIGGTPFTQVYLKLNDEYVYATIVGDYSGGIKHAN